MSTLNKLHDGVEVRAQFATRDTEDGTAPDYGPERVIRLYVLRRTHDLRRGRTVYPAGELLLVTPKAFVWAEYGPRDFSEEHQEFVCENYRMKILEVLP